MPASFGICDFGVPLISRILIIFQIVFQVSLYTHSPDHSANTDDASQILLEPTFFHTGHFSCALDRFMFYSHRGVADFLPSH